MEISKIAKDYSKKVSGLCLTHADMAAYFQAAIDKAMPDFTIHHYDRCECGRNMKTVITAGDGCIWVNGKEVSDGDKQDCEEVGT